MKEDLVDHRLDGAMHQQHFQTVHRELPINTAHTENLIGQPDRLDFTFLVQLLHLFPGPRDIAIAEPGVVDEVQVNVLDAQLGERILARFLGAFPFSTRPLGGNPLVFSGEFALFDRFSDFLLVLVGYSGPCKTPEIEKNADRLTLGGIDVVKPHLDRLVDFADADVFRDFFMTRTRWEGFTCRR